MKHLSLKSTRATASRRSNQEHATKLAKIPPNAIDGDAFYILGARLTNTTVVLMPRIASQTLVPDWKYRAYIRGLHSHRSHLTDVRIRQEIGNHLVHGHVRDSGQPFRGLEPVTTFAFRRGCRPLR